MEKVIYKNLNRAKQHLPDCWSVAALSGKVGRGTVEFHAVSITLHNVRFNVQSAARDKVAQGGNRSVHAWAIGTVCDKQAFGDNGTVISYNPRRAASFHTLDGNTIEFCEYVHFGTNGIVSAYGKIS